MGSIRGKIVGMPSCPDPAIEGLSFTVRDAGETVHFRVAGNMVWKEDGASRQQHPETALAMSAALAAAAARQGAVEVEYVDAKPEIGQPNIAGNLTVYDPVISTNTAPVTNPYASAVYSISVLDRGDGQATGLSTNLYGSANGTVYFGAADAAHTVHWSTVLALAMTTRKKVTIAWTHPGAERQIATLTLAG